jgi:hypothetical protein
MDRLCCWYLRRKARWWATRTGVPMAYVITANSAEIFQLNEDHVVQANGETRPFGRKAT